MGGFLDIGFRAGTLTPGQGQAACLGSGMNLLDSQSQDNYSLPL